MNKIDDYYKDVYSNDNIININPSSKYSLITKDEWFKNIVFYHIWIKSFYDSNNDGYGDIKGIIEKFDHIKNLGVKGIWLSPFFQCSYKGDNLHGYDVEDYYLMNEKFGTLDDLKELLLIAHENDIKVIFDYPLNHTSCKHPWFIDSCNGGKYKDWYIWNNTPGKGWNRIWDEDRSKTTWHPHNESYYYGIFHKYLPDLNFSNIEVRDEMAKILIHWLDFGFDGVRIDGARYIYEDGPDKTYDCERTHKLFQYYQEYIFKKYSEKGYNKVLIAEAWGNSEVIKTYYGNKNKKEFDICFNFPIAAKLPNFIKKKKLGLKHFFEEINYQLSNFPNKYLGGTFLTNHDLAGERPATEYKKDKQKMLLAFYIQIFLPGTPFVYYGNEIGMENDSSKNIKWDMRVRGKMRWDKIDKEIIYNYKYFIYIFNTLFSDFIDNDFFLYELSYDKFVFKRRSANYDVLFILNLNNKKIKFEINSEIIDNKKTIIDILSNKKICITNETKYNFFCDSLSINIFKLY